MAEENKNVAPAKVYTNAVKKVDEKLSFTKRVKKWFRDMKSELKKVIWPTSKQIVNNTGISLAMMVASAVGLWCFDKIASLGIQSLIDLVG